MLCVLFRSSWTMTAKTYRSESPQYKDFYSHWSVKIIIKILIWKLVVLYVCVVCPFLEKLHCDNKNNIDLNLYSAKLFYNH